MMCVHTTKECSTVSLYEIRLKLLGPSTPPEQPRSFHRPPIPALAYRDAVRQAIVPLRSGTVWCCADVGSSEGTMFWGRSAV